jgi:hypothetical protein
MVNDRLVCFGKVLEMVLNSSLNVLLPPHFIKPSVRLTQTGQCTQYILGKCTCTIIRENVRVQLSGKMYM